MLLKVYLISDTSGKLLMLFRCFVGIGHLKGKEKRNLKIVVQHHSEQTVYTILACIYYL